MKNIADLVYDIFPDDRLYRSKWYEDFLESNRKGIEDILKQIIDTQIIINSKSYVISGKEREILSLCYGLFAKESSSLEKIGAIYNLTKERIRQIKSAGIRRLRHPERSSTLKMGLHDLLIKELRSKS